VPILGRDDIVAALRDLVEELVASGDRVGIRLVGGAAIALRHFERESTNDLDATGVTSQDDHAVAEAAARVAERRGWPKAWLNFEVDQLGATPWIGRPAEWEKLYDADGVVIEVASAETLLAMKLRAGRPGRDVNDIRRLLHLCEVGTIDAAEDLYEGYYPGDSMSARTRGIVERILEEASPPPLHPVDPIRW